MRVYKLAELGGYGCHDRTIGFFADPADAIRQAVDKLNYRQYTYGYQKAVWWGGIETGCLLAEDGPLQEVVRRAERCREILMGRGTAKYSLTRFELEGVVSAVYAVETYRGCGIARPFFSLNDAVDAIVDATQIARRQVVAYQEGIWSINLTGAQSLIEVRKQWNIRPDWVGGRNTYRCRLPASIKVNSTGPGRILSEEYGICVFYVR